MNNIHRNSINPQERFRAAAILLSAHSHWCRECCSYHGCCRTECQRDPATDQYPASPCGYCADPLMIRSDQGQWFDVRYVRLLAIENQKGFFVWHNNKPIRLGIVTRAADRAKCRQYLG